MDPRKWPKVTLIGGAPLWRKIEYLEHDYYREARSMNDVPPGFSYTLRYGEGRGPVYTWSASGALVERSWRRGGNLPPEHYLYLYYPSGELMRFEYQSNVYGPRTDPTKPAHKLEEVFARNGTLIGFGHLDRRGRGNQDFIGYWLGEEVTYRELQEMEFQVQRSAYRKPSKLKQATPEDK